MRIQHSFFGDIDITEEQIIEFADGLPGFPDIRKYVIFNLPDFPPFIGLQALEDPDVGFVLVDPRFFMEDYRPVIPETELQKLGLCCVEDAQIFSTVVLNSDVSKITANLFGPILVNPQRRMAGQFVLNNDQDKYLLKYPLYQANTPKEG